MENASDIILASLKEAPEIKAAGKGSLMAMAARALSPDAPATLPGISEALGLHPGLVIAITVTSDMAGDTLSRLEFAEQLIPRLRLRTSPPNLTPEGQLRLAAWCVDQLAPLASPLDGLVERFTPVTGAMAAGQEIPALAVKAVALLAEELQRTKVLPSVEGNKSKLGISDKEALRRRAAQAVRALLKGLEDGGANPGLLPTVAGETAGALNLYKGTPAGANFCLDLAVQLESMPGEQASRPLSS